MVLAVIAEVWIGGMGISNSKVADCVKKAPTLYTYALHIGIYESWVFLLFAVVFISVIFR